MSANKKGGIRCFFCDKKIETTDLEQEQTPVGLAEQKGWAPIVINGNIAFICPKCQLFFLFFIFWR